MSNIVRMPSISPQNWSGSWPSSGCSCGCNPCQCSGGFGGVMQCWQDIAQFQQFLQCMLSQMGPFPMQGVTDGSAALPGNIGELLTGSASTPYDATTNLATNLSPLVLSPGDWDCWAYGMTSGVTGPIAFSLSPQPVGVSTDMDGRFWPPSGQSSLSTLIGIPARALVTVPTLLSFYINILAGTGQVAGTFSITVSARRRR